MVCEIQLVNCDKKVLVDDEDYQRLLIDEWQLKDWNVSRKKDGVFIHRIILNIGPVNKDRTNLVDHINRNILDNQKLNLRICNDQQNSFNRKWGRGHSKYKGVGRNQNSWVANIKKGKQKIKIGTFKKEIDAAIAYDFMARKLFGEFAYLNFPDILIDNYEEAVENSRSRMSKTKSKYMGVVPGSKYWLARIKINKKTLNIGLFDSEISAAKARDFTAIKHFGPTTTLNFFNFDYTNYQIKTVEIKYTSKYECVYYCKHSDRWMVSINHNGKSVYIGSFPEEIIAAEVADFFNITNDNPNPRNFPDKNYDNYILPKGVKKSKNKKKSNYRCVADSNSKFTAIIKINRKNFCSGVIANELDAATTADFYNYKFNGHKRKLNFPDIIKNIFQLAYN